MKLIRAIGTLNESEVEHTQAINLVFVTDSGIEASLSFVNEFLDSLDGAVLLKANGERHTFHREMTDWGVPRMRVSYAKGNGPAALAPLQPMPPEPEVFYRAPRQK